MEGLAWLLLKMSALLALTGVAFFSLGWWLRGKRSASSQDSSSAGEIEQWKAALSAAESERDGARRQLADADARAESAEREVARLRLIEQAQAATSVPAPDLVLTAPQEEAPRPKAKAKPRAKKKSKA